MISRGATAAKSESDPLGSEAAAKTRLGRNRFLAVAGGALLGFAATLTGKAEPAWAACGSASPCVKYGLCCCCSGTECCQSNCVRNTNECGVHGCWTTCNGAGSLFQCCDWYSTNPCICRTIIGGC